MKSSQILTRIAYVVLLVFALGCAANKPSVQSPPPQPAAQTAKPSVIEKVSFTEEPRYTRIVVAASEPVAPPFYKLLSDPLRIVIDVPNADLRQIKGPIRVDNGTIQDIVVTQFDDKGRVEIGLTQMANYNLSKEGKTLLIDVERVKRVEEVKEAPKEDSSSKEKLVPAPTPEVKKEETLPVQPVVASPPPPEPLNKAKELVNLAVDQKEDYALYVFSADGKIENYDSFKLDGPTRLVLDVWNVGSRIPQKSVKSANAFVKDVRIGRYPDKVRLVFDASKPQLPPYQINRAGDKLIVSFGNVPASAMPQASPPETVVGGGTPAAAGGPAKSQKPSTLKEIDFKQMDSVSRIVVSLTGEPAYQAYMLAKDTLAVDIKNTSAPKRLLRPLDTSEFETAVDSVILQNIRMGKTTDLRLLVKLREEVPFAATQEGNTLFIDLDRPKKTEVKAEAGPPKTEGPSSEAQKEEAAKAVSAEEKGSTPQGPETTREGRQEKIYTGRKISLDFKDADIKNVLRLIAEVSDLNIITGDDVGGKVTMRLVDVPWDQALDVILQSRSLGMSRVGNVVRVAPQDTLKKEIQGELEAKRARDRLEDLVTELIPVNYATAKEVIPQVKSILGDRGDVRVDDRTNMLIIKDVPRNMLAVRNLVKSLDTKTPQVLIEARIIEASVGFQQELGVSWGALVSTGESKNKTFKLGGGLPGTTVDGTTRNNIVSLPAIPATGSPVPGLVEFLFTSVYGLKELDIAVSAHENKGDVRIISSPKIATLDNKQASVEQGLRIPYLKLTTEGTVTTDFIEANLKLTVTPHVTNDGNIKMLIDVRKDAPDYTVTVQGVPRIDKKEAISEVLVRDNGVVVIAGVYSIEKDDTNEGIPLFNKLPLLGWLFKRQTKNDQRKDLLIFISPKILRDQA